MASGNELLTVAQVAALLQLSEKTVLRWLKSGRLRGKYLGSNQAGWRIWRSDVERFLSPEPGQTRAA